MKTIYVHCPQKEQAHRLIELTNSKAGFYPVWNSYKEETVFRIKNDKVEGFEDLRYLKTNCEWISVVSFSDFIKNRSWYCLENVLSTFSQDNRCELFGLLIDAVEDFLTEKGLSSDDIPNEEREDVGEDAALIYGSDYDNLADRFAKVLGLDRWEKEQFEQSPTITR